MRHLPAHLLAAAGAVIVASHAPAQTQDPKDDGPVVIGGERAPWKPFDLRRLTGGVDLLARRTSDKLRQTGQPDTTDTETLYRELLELSWEAYLGHKNLVDLTGNARLGLEDRFLNSDTFGVDDHASDLAWLFDLNAHVLAESRVPFDAYARRDEQLLDREFSTNITNRLFEYGVAASIRSEVAPTTVRLFRSENEQTDQVGLNDYSLTQNSFALNSNIRLGDGHRAVVDYALDDVRERQGTLFQDDYIRHDLLIADTLDIGSTKGQALRSFFRYYNQDGRSSQEIARLEEQLDLVHSRTLESRYNTTLERLSRAGVDQDTARAYALVRHRLFDSLVSTASTGGQWLSASNDLTSHEWFLEGSLDYTKKTPGGRINANLGASFRSTSTSSSGGTFTVVDESHVFTDPQPITIARQNVVQGSVVVTAVGGFPTYQEGFDFTIEYFPDRAEIRPIIGRGISDGQTVLVDYSYQVGEDENVNPLGLVATFRYTFTDGSLRGLSLYTTLRDQHYDASSTGPTRFSLEGGLDLTLGAEYRRGGFRASAEWQDRNTTTSPYQTTRLKASYDFLFSRGSTLALDATYDLTDYSEPGNSVAFSRLSARWVQRVGAELECTARLDLRDENDQLRGDSQGLDQILSVRWRRRQTTAYATLRNTWFQSGDSDRESQFIEIGLRRAF